MRKLEIGPGGRAHAGYDTLDKNPLANPTFCMDITSSPWSIPSEAYDEVLAVHVIEHVSHSQVDGVFREVLRLLAPRGVFRVHVPDGPLLAKAYLDQKNQRIPIQAAIYGGEAESDPAFAHKALYDSEALITVFKRNGFADIRNVTESLTDVHDQAWMWLGGKISLKIQGQRP